MKRHFAMGSILRAPASSAKNAEFVDFTGQRKGSILWGVPARHGGTPFASWLDGLFHGTSQSNMDDLGLSCG